MGFVFPKRFVNKLGLQKKMCLVSSLEAQHNSVYLNKCIFCILHFCPQCLFSFLHVLLRVRMAKSQVLKNIMLFSPQPCCVLSFLIKKPEIKMNKCVFSFLYGLLSWRCVLWSLITRICPHIAWIAEILPPRIVLKIRNMTQIKAINLLLPYTVICLPTQKQGFSHVFLQRHQTWPSLPSHRDMKEISRVISVCLKNIYILKVSGFTSIAW